MMSSHNHAIGDLQGTNELTSQGADFMAAACRTLLGSSRDVARYSIQRYLQQLLDSWWVLELTLCYCRAPSENVFRMVVKSLSMIPARRSGVSLMKAVYFIKGHCTKNRENSNLQRLVWCSTSCTAVTKHG